MELRGFEPLTFSLQMRGSGQFGLLWHNPDGTPIAPRADLDEWHALLDRAGVPPRALHSARGTTASLLRRAGVADAVRIALLGHASIASTAAYDHTEQMDKIEALEALSARLAVPGTVAPPPPPADRPALRLVK